MVLGEYGGDSDKARRAHKKALYSEIAQGKEIKAEEGGLRQLTMDLLYREDGLTGPEIGRIFGIGYSSVSQERRRLREKLEKDHKLRGLLGRIEYKMSTSKN